MIDYRFLNKVSPPCPVCGGMDFQPLASNDRYGMGVQTAGCLHCGLAQTWPRPTPESMATFYREHYRQYYQEAANPDAAYISRYHKGERLKYTAELIAANVKLLPGMRVLDIGCAEGTLIANLKLKCEDIVSVGVEPSDSFSAYARQTTGCVTYPDVHALSAAGETAFDLVIVNHVLEHVDDPVDFLARLRRLTVPNGKVYVDVPNVTEYTSPQMLHIAHLFHFSEGTLSATFEKAGFWVISTAPHAPPHHPSSIWCLAENRGISSQTAQIGTEHEKLAWGKIWRIGKAVPLYLLKIRLRRNKVVSALWERFRMLRQRTT
jgi:2-polyprenyl-3-methyl-5-hydroxy-6-metoxy-1,4-benzoquinol methylase